MRALGAEVTLVMREQKVMEGCHMDGSVQDAVMARMRRVGIRIRPDSGIFSEVRPGPEGSVVLADSGEVIPCDALLSATGRVGLADAVDITAAGCAPPSRGGATVDGATMRCIGRNTDHIYAVGDCTSEGSQVKPQGLLSTGLAEAIIVSALPSRRILPSALHPSTPPPPSLSLHWPSLSVMTNTSHSLTHSTLRVFLFAGHARCLP